MVLTKTNNNIRCPFPNTCSTGLSEASNSAILQDFPAKSRALLGPELIIVKKCEMGASTKATEKRTACTRRIHFIFWCIIRQVFDQVFPVIKLSDNALVYLLACYTAFLATGHAIGLKSIKSGTVDGYLLTIAKFLKNFDQKSDRDARMFRGSQTIATPIKKVIDEMKRFEKQANRREPWTLQLQARLYEETSDEPEDSLAKAGCQWYSCILPAGCRRVEWCQPYANRDPNKKPEQNSANETYAFCIGDILFLGIRQQRFTTAFAIANREQVQYVELTFRWQKERTTWRNKAILSEPPTCLSRHSNPLAHYRRPIRTTSRPRQ